MAVLYIHEPGTRADAVARAMESRPMPIPCHECSSTDTREITAQPSAVVITACDACYARAYRYPDGTTLTASGATVLAYRRACVDLDGD